MKDLIAVWVDGTWEDDFSRIDSSNKDIFSAIVDPSLVKDILMNDFFAVDPVAMDVFLSGYRVDSKSRQLTISGYVTYHYEDEEMGQTFMIASFQSDKLGNIYNVCRYSDDGHEDEQELETILAETLFATVLK